MLLCQICKTKSAWICACNKRGFCENHVADHLKELGSHQIVARREVSFQLRGLTVKNINFISRLPIKPVVYLGQIKGHGTNVLVKIRPSQDYDVLKAEADAWSEFSLKRYPNVA
jgi:hypothetical protein